MSEELKPCPFCGHTATKFFDEVDWYVGCGGPWTDCRTLPTVSANSEQAAIAAWNTRHQANVAVPSIDSIVALAEAYAGTQSKSGYTLDKYSLTSFSVALIQLATQPNQQEG